MNPEITRLFAAKQARRHKLAGLPFPDKVKLVVKLQKMAAPIYRARGRLVRIWQIPDPKETEQKKRSG